MKESLGIYACRRVGRQAGVCRGRRARMQPPSRCPCLPAGTLSVPETSLGVLTGKAVFKEENGKHAQH